MQLAELILSGAGHGISHHATSWISLEKNKFCGWKWNFLSCHRLEFTREVFSTDGCGSSGHANNWNNF